MVTRHFGDNLQKKEVSIVCLEESQYRSMITSNDEETDLILCVEDVSDEEDTDNEAIFQTNDGLERDDNILNNGEACNELVTGIIGYHDSEFDSSAVSIGNNESSATASHLEQNTLVINDDVISSPHSSGLRTVTLVENPLQMSSEMMSSSGTSAGVSVEPKTVVKREITQFKCDVCDRSFVSKSCLVNHSKTHKPSRPYQCGLCQKAFTYNINLENHIKKHNIKRTDKRTSRKSNKKADAFMCLTCKKWFAFASTLVTHLMTHPGEKKYCVKTGDEYKTMILK